VKAKVYFRAAAHRVKGRTFLQVEDKKMDFSVRDIKMGIENLHNGNTVLRKYCSNMATGWTGGVQTRFKALSQNCEKRILASSCLSVRPSVHVEQLGSHWKDYHDI
jgi:hypothetical protein